MMKYPIWYCCQVISDFLKRPEMKQELGILTVCVNINFGKVS